jgi:hypothetical protein
VGGRAVDVDRLGRVLLAAFDAPDALEQARGEQVELDGPGARALADGARLDGLREREDVSPRRQRGLIGGQSPAGRERAVGELGGGARSARVRGAYVRGAPAAARSGPEDEGGEANAKAKEEPARR